MKKIFLTLSIFTLLFTACERVDYGDLNQNPYSPTEDNIDGMVRTAMIAFGEQGNRAGYDVASCYAQYQTQVSYTQEQTYSQFKGAWGRNYVYVLNNLKRAHDVANDSRGATTNVKVTTELMSVMVWKRITDTFGDVPYFEALQGGSNITPAYTPQRDIYLDLIARAKAARDMIDPAAFTLDADTDIYYGGDMDKWGKFANSLILALTIQLSNTSEAAFAQGEFQAALANSYGVIESNADNFTFTPDNAGGNKNPISYERVADYMLSKELTDALNGYAGPWGSLQTDSKNVTSTAGNSTDFRIYAYEGGTADGAPYGYSSGTAGADMSANYTAASSDFVLLSAAYTWLNRAEAADRGWTSENATTMLTNGIVASFAAAENMAGFTFPPANNGAAKATERLLDVAGTVTLAQVIGEEKWFALFPDGYAAWAEQRRTHYPALMPAPDAINGGVIPHRMLYPSGEAATNPNGYTQGLQGLTPADDKNTSKIWWE